MDLRSGRLYWPQQSPSVPSYPALAEDASCDVVIVGAGITGAMLADRFTQAGVDTVVLDKRRVGAGSTSASTAVLLYELDVHLGDLIDRVGERAAVRSYALGREALDRFEALPARLGDDCGFTRRKSVYLAEEASNVRALEQEYHVRKKYGFDLDWLDRADVEARFPFSRPAALLTPEAAQVDAYRMTHRLLQTAAAQGARVYEQTEVAGYEPTRNGCVVQTARGARVTAGRVVFATGYEAQPYLRLRAVQSKSTYVVVSRPLEGFMGWFDQALIWETARPYLYIRTTGDGRAMVGGADEPFQDPEKRDRLIQRKSAALEAAFEDLFPEIPFEVAYAWAGTFDETDDGLPYMGVLPTHPHAYFSLCYGGNGITFSLLAAEILCDLYLGRKNRDAELFRLDRA